MTLEVQFISDVVCPWCALGQQKLVAAINEVRNQVSIAVRFLPYELNPDLGPDGMLLSSHLSHIMNADAERIAGVQAHMTKLGEDVGFTFNFTPNSRIYNTHKAHQLMGLADEQGLGLQAHTAILNRYFTLGEDISDMAVLLSIAEELELDNTRVGEILENNLYSDKVRTAIGRVRALGITGVPALIVNDQIVQGAREVSDLVALFKHSSESATV